MTHRRDRCIIIVCGLPGTGKTTFAAALAESMDAVHLNTDRIRHDLGKQGAYSASAKSGIYDHLFVRTRQVLLSGRVVVLDGTFYKEKVRKPFVQLARQLRLPVYWIELEASEDTIRQRVAKVRPYTEADFEAYEKVRDTFDPLPRNRLTLDSDALTIPQMLERATAYCRDTGQ